MNNTAWKYLMVGILITVAGCQKSEAASQIPAESVVQASAEPTPAPSSEAKPAPVGGGNVCEQICRHVITMACGTTQTCLEGCLSMLAADVCKTELAAFLDCTASKPVDAFECDEQAGAPALKENECVTEQAAVGACMDKQ